MLGTDAGDGAAGGRVGWPAGLMESLPAINEAFGRDSLLEVVASLEQQAGQGSGLAR